MAFLRRLNPLIYLLGALAGYYLPWDSHPAAGLSAHAYDLAEWTTLIPAVHGANPPFIPTFLLRAVLVGLALLFGIQAFNRSLALWQRIAAGVLAIWLAITLLPPPEFFSLGQWDNPDFRQQLALSLATFILLGVLMFLRNRSAILRYGSVIIGGLVILCAIAGEIMALNAVRTLKIDAPVGIGVFALVIFIGLYLIAGYPVASNG